MKRKSVCGLLGVLLGVLLCPAAGDISLAQEDDPSMEVPGGFPDEGEPTAPEPDSSCPGRPGIFLNESAGVTYALSREVRCIIPESPLVKDEPSPTDSPDLLRRFTRQAPYDNLSASQYLTVAQEAVQLWPNSRYAYAALGAASAQLYGESHDLAHLQAAAQAYSTAARLGLQAGVTVYVFDAIALLVETQQQPGLDSLKPLAVSVTEPGAKYEILLSLGRAYTLLNSPQAEPLLLQAISLQPPGVWSGYEWYLDFLLRKGRYAAVLAYLTPAMEQKMDPAFFHLERCKALEALGRTSEAAVECGLARSPEPPPPGVGNGVQSESFVPQPWNGSCKTSRECLKHPDDPDSWYGRCWHPFVWDLARVILNEGASESPGAKATIAWTVRDRVNKNSYAADCQPRGSGDTSCTQLCPPSDPSMCLYQREYRCVIHAPNQFVDWTTDRSKLIPWQDLKVAGYTVNGRAPDMLSKFIPSGAQGCHPADANCETEALMCYKDGAYWEYAPDGPYYFVAKSLSQPCPGEQDGPAGKCYIAAWKQCENAKANDNCFSRPPLRSKLSSHPTIW